jgi:renalase
VRVVVIGAGLSGLVCARELQRSGHAVTVLDKGASVGGRLATRRIVTPLGIAVVDHGAQFFTVRSEEMAAEAAAWTTAGVVTEWCRGFGDGDGWPRYRGTAGMNGIAKHLAAQLGDAEVRVRTLAFSLHAVDGAWRVRLDDGSELDADAVVCTAPVPQAYALAVSAELEVPRELMTMIYDPTLSLLVVLDGPSAVPAPGGVQEADEVFHFVADNARKGVSELSALTLHARPVLSAMAWERDPDAVHAELLAAATPWFGGASVVTSQLKRWRFATPQSSWPEPCVAFDGADAGVGGRRGPLVLAGDAYAGPKVEGALRSGLAAARALI